MRTLFKFAFKKVFLILVGALCLILFILRLIFPMVGLERAELTPTDFSVIGKSDCYLGRGDSLYVYKEGIHVNTLVLPKELKGYKSFVVLPNQLLFNNNDTIWQADLDMSAVRECDNQEDAKERLNAKKRIDRRDYRCIVKTFYGLVEDNYTLKSVARLPAQDSFYRSAFLLLVLVILIHGIRVSLLLFKLKRNGKENRHPNLND